MRALWLFAPRAQRSRTHRRIFQGNRPKLLQVVTLSKWCSALKEKHTRCVELMWEKRPFWYSAQTQINTLGWKSWRSHVRWSLYLSALWFRGSFIIKLRATGDVIESVHIQLSCEIPFCAGWKDTSSCNRELSVHQLNFWARSEWILCQLLTNRQV